MLSEVSNDRNLIWIRLIRISFYPCRKSGCSCGKLRTWRSGGLWRCETAGGRQGIDAGPSRDKKPDA